MLIPDSNAHGLEGSWAPCFTCNDFVRSAKSAFALLRRWLSTSAGRTFQCWSVHALATSSMAWKRRLKIVARGRISAV